MKQGWGLFVLAGALLLVMLISLRVGPTSVSTSEIARIIWEGIWQKSAGVDVTIIWSLRIPRVLLATLVGFGLGGAGAGFQGFFRNPLADPYIIGASSGAALGATIATVSGWQGGWLGLLAVPVSAMSGALLAVMTVNMVASMQVETPVLSLLLAGVAVSTLIGAIVSLLMYFNDDTLTAIMAWLLGSLSGAGWERLLMSAPMIVMGIGGLWLLSRVLDVLTFGEEAARALGMRLLRMRRLIIFNATLATAGAVAGGGIIGFVGLIAPHVARRLVGPRHAILIPASGCVGGMLLLVADNLARTIHAPAELPVGVLTAIVGGGFFLFLMSRRRTSWGATA